MTDGNYDTEKFQSMAKTDFEVAYQKGFWRAVLSWFTQTDNRLLPFDEVRRHIPMEGQHYLGLREVPTDQIVGSVGRYQDFDRAFLPRQTTTRSRWMSIDRAQIADIPLPPIEVYKIGDAYFVKDGNHRVSVARERGQVFIDANVIEIDVPVPIDNTTNIDDLIRKHEQADFVTQTRINDLRPNAKIELTLPGQYEKLLEHISVHRWFRGERLKRPISKEEAVQSWYDDVYLPLVRVIREKNVLKDFPGRSESDLYLWIIEHLWYLRAELKKEVSLEQAASHFVNMYSNRSFRWVKHSFRRAATWLKRILPTRGAREKEDKPRG